MDGQVLLIDLGPLADNADNFRLRFSPTGAAPWTPYSTSSASPTVSEPLSVGVLDGSIYTLDGLNGATGNMEAASAAGNSYEAAWQAGGPWSNWSQVFGVTAPTVAAGWPTLADVQYLLVDMGLTLTAGQIARIPANLAAAIAEFEQRTNRHPLLAPETDSTRQLNPPATYDGVIHLDRDLATLTSIAYQTQGGTSSALTTTQYLAEPVNAVADGRPYERILLTYRGWTAPLYYPQRGSIYVTGRWGYSVTVPNDVRLAVAYRAAAVTLGVNRFALTGGVKSWADADRRIEYGTGAADLLGASQSIWESAVANYRRVTV